MSGQMPPPDWTTTKLIRGIQANEGPAWEAFARIYTPLVYCWCREFELDEHTAQDVAQDVFLAVLKGIKRFRQRPDSTLCGWLWTVTRHEILDSLRRGDARANGREVPLPMEIPEPTPIPDPDDEDVIRGPLGRALSMVQQRVSERTFGMFCRSVVDGFPADMVVEQFKATTNTFWLARGRVLCMLRELLGDEIPAEWTNGTSSGG